MSGHHEGETIRSRRELQFPCPCGQTAYIDRNIDTGEQFITHPMPPCETFNRYDHPADYLLAVREHLTGTKEKRQ